MLPGGPWPAEGPALVLPALSVLPSAPRSAITGVITPSIALRRARRPGRYDRRLTWPAGKPVDERRATVSADMPDFPDTVRLTQEAPGMVGDTIAGTRAGVRHTRRRYAATLAALIAASAMVAGCTTSTAGPGVTTTATSGSSTATTTPTATATSTPSATTAPTAAYPADVPAEARANTPAGAIAFAKHFFGLVNRAYTTPQAGLLPPLSTANCKTCAAFESTAARLRCTVSTLRSGCRLDLGGGHR
jgi:hypothetical protein